MIEMEKYFCDGNEYTDQTEQLLLDNFVWSLTLTSSTPTGMHSCCGFIIELQYTNLFLG